MTMNLIRVMMVVVFLVLPVSAQALSAYGIQVENTVVVNGQTLQLNGFGLRSKWFVRVYVGSLYLNRQTGNGMEVINNQGEKLIRLSFLHSRVTRNKIIEAINEGFARNAGRFADSADAQRFHNLFVKDFFRGDVLDLVFSSDGSVTVKLNNAVLGTIESRPLQSALLKTFFGMYPADEALKAGMLGRL
jgi:hypothetical protein